MVLENRFIHQVKDFKVFSKKVLDQMANYMTKIITLFRLVKKGGDDQSFPDLHFLNLDEENMLNKYQFKTFLTLMLIDFF